MYRGADRATSGYRRYSGHHRATSRPSFGVVAIAFRPLKSKCVCIELRWSATSSGDHCYSGHRCFLTYISPPGGLLPLPFRPSNLKVERHWSATASAYHSGHHRFLTYTSSPFRLVADVIPPSSTLLVGVALDRHSKRSPPL